MIRRKPFTEPLALRELPNPEQAKPGVLVVDDDEAIVIGIAAKLGADFRVMGVHNPHEAVATALRERPALILCDINMPGMKGDEVAFALSDNPGTTDIPLVYLTALVDSPEIDELDGLFGDHPVISKSASTPELRAMVFQALGLPSED